MAGELKWQRYFMDAPMKGSRLTYLAVFNRPPGPSVATRQQPGVVLGFGKSPELVSLASGGTVRWKRKLEAPVIALSIEGTKDGLFVALSNGIIYHLDNTGKPLWKFKVGAAANAVSASEKGGCAAAADDTGKVVVLSLEGKLLWTAKLENPVTMLKLSQDGTTVLAVDAGNGVSTISREGKVLWRKSFIDGIHDIATTAGCTKTLVLSKTVRNISLDGSERWAVTVADAGAVRMSDDGDALYAISPSKVTRLRPNGKVQWERPVQNVPRYASVMPRTKVLILPSKDTTTILDRWGNIATECPLPPSPPGDCRGALFDGERTFVFVRGTDSQISLVAGDAGPTLVDYLLRAAKCFAEESLKVGQPSPFGEKHFTEASEAAAQGDFPRAWDNAQFSYRFYEETLASIQKATDTLVNAESMARMEVTAAGDLNKKLSTRKATFQAKCSCGKVLPVYSKDVPLLVRCEDCGKLGLVKKVP